jgi:hypothetical protein
MFFFIAITSDTREIGHRLCRHFPCCGRNDSLAAVTCVSRRLILFFLPLFRFGKRYFISCPNCGSVYEISRDEGRRLENDPTAEINPDRIYRMVGRTVRYCPNCGAPVEPGSRYCPSCGKQL